MIKSAIISPCGLYRYRLSRRWAEAGLALPIIMLNPSTADAELDDPTIRRCLGFANREGFMGIEVYNLFAFRSPSPRSLLDADDPVGPVNDSYLESMMASAKRDSLPILCGWGANGDLSMRGHIVKRMAEEANASLSCLGQTRSGHPKHPLYIRADQPFVEFK